MTDLNKHYSNLIEELNTTEDNILESKLAQGERLHELFLHFAQKRGVLKIELIYNGEHKTALCKTFSSLFIANLITRMKEVPAKNLIVMYIIYHIIQENIENRTWRDMAASWISNNSNLLHLAECLKGYKFEVNLSETLQANLKRFSQKEFLISIFQKLEKNYMTKHPKALNIDSYSIRKADFMEILKSSTKPDSPPSDDESLDFSETEISEEPELDSESSNISNSGKTRPVREKRQRPPSTRLSKKAKTNGDELTPQERIVNSPSTKTNLFSRISGYKRFRCYGFPFESSNISGNVVENFLGAKLDYITIIEGFKWNLLVVLVPDNFALIIPPNWHYIQFEPGATSILMGMITGLIKRTPEFIYNCLSLETTDIEGLLSEVNTCLFSSRKMGIYNVLQKLADYLEQHKDPKFTDTIKTIVHTENRALETLDKSRTDGEDVDKMEYCKHCKYLAYKRYFLINGDPICIFCMSRIKNYNVPKHNNNIKYVMNRNYLEFSSILKTLPKTGDFSTKPTIPDFSECNIFIQDTKIIKEFKTVSEPTLLELNEEMIKNVEKLQIKELAKTLNININTEPTEHIGIGRLIRSSNTIIKFASN